MGLRALLVGINAYADAPLRGCVNDVMSMRDYLKGQHRLKDTQLRILTDAEASRQAIIDGLNWLTEPDQEPGSAVRLFHYSGHGVFIADQNGDEPDGRDEALVPYDHQTAGVLIDDALREACDRFKSEIHLLLTLDCCHSGTATRVLHALEQTLDIRYRGLPLSKEEQEKIENSKRAFQLRKQQSVFEQLSDMRTRDVAQDEWEARIKAAMEQFDKKHFGQDTLKGNTVLLAACSSGEKAADARFGADYHGALSYLLLETIHEQGGQLSYNGLIEQLGNKMKEKGLDDQTPQLECSDENRACGFLNLAL